MYYFTVSFRVVNLFLQEEELTFVKTLCEHIYRPLKEYGKHLGYLPTISTTFVSNGQSNTTMLFSFKIEGIPINNTTKINTTTTVFSLIHQFVQSHYPDAEVLIEDWADEEDDAEILARNIPNDIGYVGEEYRRVEYLKIKEREWKRQCARYCYEDEILKHHLDYDKFIHFRNTGWKVG